MLYKRNILNRVLKSLQNNPVVLINGARQVGKSTLIEELLKSGFDAEYLTFDDSAILFAASQDSYGLLSSFSRSIVIDEVQRELDVFLAIKRIVDVQKKDGQFLLTGSANVLTVPRVSESLAGRMILHTLWPLTQGEIENKEENFIEWAFESQKLPSLKKQLSMRELCQKIVTGGYPRSVRAADDMDRTEWMRSYVDTIVQRDIRELSNIEGLKELPNILSVLAGRVGNLLNLSDISRMLKINLMSLKRYYSLLQMVFLVVESPAWSVNTDKRLAKSPKIYMADTGIASYFRRIQTDDLLKDPSSLGALLENFVMMELKKQATWSPLFPSIYHFRTQAGKEVDIVLEGMGKKIVGIEVKASTTIHSKDLAGLKELRDIAKEKFVKGIILYSGEKILKLDHDIYALPINSLWESMPLS